MQTVLKTAKLLRASLLLLSCVASITSVAYAQDGSKSSFLQTSASAHYDNALLQIDARSFTEALSLLRRIQAYYPGFEKLSEVQTRIAVLQEADDAPDVVGHYLRALNQRDANDVAGALSTLDFILLQYTDSPLHDDAMYLKAYVQIMDRYDFAAARLTLAQLQQLHPDSSYQDSVDYLDAIALEQLGQTANAKMALEALRDKHTSVSLPFGFSLPSGNVLSRYWYDRADRRLDIIDQRSASASQLRSKQEADSGAWRVQVNVDGVDLEYELTPSPLTQRAGWVDGGMQDRLPPAAGVFVGEVVGDAESWVRAVIVDNTITGIAYAFGRSYTMQPGTLIGTLDYYQPRSEKDRSASSPDSVSTEATLEHDVLQAPPELGAARYKRNTTKQSDLRVVPVSIVIDAEFDRYHGGSGLVVALNQLNVADGIYRQFGLALAVDEVQVFGDNDYNSMQTAPSTLEGYLNSFRGYRQDNRALFNDSALTYLFTGKERTDRTLGLAWIDTLCRTDGYDVGITTPSAIGDVLLTHEIGHSLGSQHDSDTSCNQDASKIMWPHISSRTEVEFSDCSQVSLSGARAKSCLIDAVDISLNAEGVYGGVQFDVSNLDSSIGVDMTLMIETSVSGLIALPAGCNEVSPTSAQCAISSVAAGETRNLYLEVDSERVENTAVITGQLTPVGTQDFTPANNVVSFSLGSGDVTSEHLEFSTTPENVPANDDTPAESGGSGATSKAGLLVLSLLNLMTVLKVKRSAEALSP